VSGTGAFAVALADGAFVAAEDEADGFGVDDGTETEDVPAPDDDDDDDDDDDVFLSSQAVERTKRTRSNVERMAITRSP
jgi:hypothetical protein